MAVLIAIAAIAFVGWALVSYAMVLIGGVQYGLVRPYATVRRALRIARQVDDDYDEDGIRIYGNPYDGPRW